MRRAWQQSIIPTTAVALLFCLAAVGAEEPKPAYVRSGALEAKEAVQAAAADERIVYAIDSASIAKYDRSTGKRLAASTGKAEHLNSGFLFDGKLYCAHSNYPKKPARSEIMALDPETMALTTFRAFEGDVGSLTWAVRQRGHWWCNFAYYDDDNAKTYLVKFDDRWTEVERWTYPKAVLTDLGRYSLSGGLWVDDILLATGHDKRVIYRLRLPKEGQVLELVDVVPSPFPGQGIAPDGKAGGLVGIDRGKHEVIFATLKR